MPDIAIGLIALGVFYVIGQLLYPWPDLDELTRGMKPGSKPPVDGVIELSGWRALRRWLTCKLGRHSSTCEVWDATGDGRLMRFTVTVWCDDCGRPLKPAERARCRTCGQPVSRRQAPERGEVQP